MNSFRLLLTVIVMAIAITAVFISTTLQAQEGQVDDVQISPPTSTEIYHLFPRGTDAVLEFGTAIATGPVGATITYSIEYKLDGTVTPLSDLFLTEVIDEAAGTITYKSATHTIEQYRTAYGTTGAMQTISATLTATNGDTDTLDFNIYIQHDQSPQWDAPATYVDDNRWQIAFAVYEGPAAAATFSWSSTHSEEYADRRWATKHRTQDAQPTIECSVDHSTTTDPSTVWPDTVPDGYLFERTASPSAPHSYPSGTFTMTFDNSNPDATDPADLLKFPDYENPHDDNADNADNTYHLRLISDNLTDQQGMEPYLGCTGSAVDISITIKDVGPPDPPTIITGDFNADEATEINLSWDRPDHIRRQRHDRRLPAFRFRAVQVLCTVPR